MLSELFQHWEQPSMFFFHMPLDSYINTMSKTRLRLLGNMKHPKSRTKSSMRKCKLKSILQMQGDLKGTWLKRNAKSDVSVEINGCSYSCGTMDNSVFTCKYDLPRSSSFHFHFSKSILHKQDRMSRKHTKPPTTMEPRIQILATMNWT